MRVIVSKFGGSSLAGAECFRQVLSIVRQSPARRCVVLSAPGRDGTHPEKVTALLERCWQLRKDPAALEPAIAEAAERYAKIARALSVFDVRPMCLSEITNALYISRDHALSRGEFLCACVFCAWSGFDMVDAARLIRFDAAGRLNEARTLSQLRTLNGFTGPVVVPGFYGADDAARIVTFPRNGSDITGALAAAGMEAGLYENWTDVPGLMTADPAVVPNARLIPQVSYRQMRQLARAGAQVLHPACLDPVAMAGIPTRLRCTRDPESFGTLIDDHCGGIARCLVGRREAKPPEGVSDGMPVSRVCAFGCKKADVQSAARRVGAVRVENRDEDVCIYLPRSIYPESLRELHRLLLE